MKWLGGVIKIDKQIITGNYEWQTLLVSFSIFFFLPLLYLPVASSTAHLHILYVSPSSNDLHSIHPLNCSERFIAHGMAALSVFAAGARSSSKLPDVRCR